VSKRSVLLLSGGLDSTACLDFLINKNYNVSPLYIDYGQVSNKREKSSAIKICNYYKLDLKVINISELPKYSGEIIGRNALLLIMALMINNDFNGLVSIGIHSGTSYRDCSAAFISSMQKIFDIYSDGKIQLYVPFLHWTKDEIWSYSLNNKIPINLTYSCELGLNQPCGKCISCSDLIRLYAIKK